MEAFVKILESYHKAIALGDYPLALTIIEEAITECPQQVFIPWLREERRACVGMQPTKWWTVFSVKRPKTITKSGVK